MNTFKKSSSIALAIAFGFSMLATSTSLNAQSREDSDDAGSERSINASDAKPAAKPTVSFSQSVKAKVATQAAAPRKDVKPTDAKAAPAPAPVTNQTRVNQNTTAGPKTWTKTTASQQINASGSESDSKSNRIQSESTKVAATKIATPANTSAVKNNVAAKPVRAAAQPKVLEYQDDLSLGAEENEKAKAAFNKKKEIAATPAKEIVKPVVASTPTVKYENASPGRTPKAETHKKPSAPIQIATIVEQNEVKGLPANEKSR